MPNDTKYIVNGAQLTDIGAAIRSKLDEQDTYTVDEMPEKISEISGGGESPINYLKLNITNVSTSYDLYDCDDANADSSLDNYFTDDFGATYRVYNPNRNAMVLAGTASKNLIAEKNGGKGVAYLIPVWQTNLSPGKVARFDIGTSMYESIESVNNVTLDETPFACTIELTDPTKPGEINISLKEYIPD